MDNKVIELLQDIKKAVIVSTKEMMTTEDACELLGISKSYLHSLCADGELTYYQRKAGAKVYFDRNDLIQFMRQGKHNGIQDINIDAMTYLFTNSKSQIL